MDITKIQSAGYNITYIAQPGEHGPRVLVDWRSPIAAVKAQIIAAYGKAVFDAADVYARANPIVVPLVIEDYNLVCSLPYETRPSGLPYRYLVGDGTAYIVTPSGDFTDGDIEEAKAKFYATIMNNESAVFGIGDWPNFYFAYGWYQNKMGLFQASSGNMLGNIPVQVNTILEIEIKNSNSTATSLVINGEDKGLFSGTGKPRNSTKNFDIFCRNETRPMTGGIAYVERIKNGNQTALFLPFELGVARTAEQVYPQSLGAQPVGTKGMIDLVSGKFHPNANSSGSFTELIE